MKRASFVTEVQVDSEVWELFDGLTESNSNDHDSRNV